MWRGALRLREVQKSIADVDLGEWGDLALDEQERLLLRWNLAIALQRGIQLRTPGEDPTLNELILHSKIWGNQKLQIVGSDKFSNSISAERTQELNIPQKIAIDPLAIKEDKVYERLSDELGRNFVLKTNHDSGGVRFITSNESFEEGLKYLEQCRRKVYGLSTAETSYFAVERRIFAEENVTEDSSAAMDVKCHCFNGNIFLFQVIFDRYRDAPTKEILLNANLEEVDGLLDFNFQSERLASVPTLLEKLGRRVTDDVSSVAAYYGGYVRVDLLIGGTGVSLGETTFFPYGGFYPNLLPKVSLGELAGEKLLDWSVDLHDFDREPKLSPRELLKMGFQNSKCLGFPGRLNFQTAQLFLKGIGF